MFPAVLLQVIIILLVCGVLLWGLQQIPAVDPAIKGFIRVAVIVVVAIWLIMLLADALGTPVFHR